jgi:hypothetical protein
MPIRNEDFAFRISSIFKRGSKIKVLLSSQKAFTIPYEMTGTSLLMRAPAHFFTPRRRHLEVAPATPSAAVEDPPSPRLSARPCVTAAIRRLRHIVRRTAPPPQRQIPRVMAASTFARLTGVSAAWGRQTEARPAARVRQSLPRRTFSALALGHGRIDLRDYVDEIFEELGPDITLRDAVMLAMYLQARDRAIEESENEITEIDAPPKSVKMTAHAISRGECEKDLSCPVCLSQFECGEDGIVNLKCGHLFHRDCLAPWFAHRHTCPVCRADVDEGDHATE